MVKQFLVLTVNPLPLNAYFVYLNFIPFRNKKKKTEMSSLEKSSTNICVCSCLQTRVTFRNSCCFAFGIRTEDITAGNFCTDDLSIASFQCNTHLAIKSAKNIELHSPNRLD